MLHWGVGFIPGISAGITGHRHNKALHNTTSFLSTSFPKKGFKTAQISRIKASSFFHHAFLFPRIPFRAWCKGDKSSQLQIIFISWFSVYFAVFPCQGQGRSLLIQEECISEETGKGKSSLLTLSWGGKLYLWVEKQQEKMIIEPGAGQGNFSAGWSKQTFQLDDPNELEKIILQNHKMVWVGTELKAHLIPTPCLGQGDQWKPICRYSAFPGKKHLRKATLGQSNISFGLKVTDLWHLSHLINFYLQFRSVLLPSIKSKEAFEVHKSNIFQNETLSIFFLLHFWLETSIFHQMD